MTLDVVDTLANLVRIPSVNPMGRDVSGDIYLEGRLTNHLEGLFQQLGWPYRRQLDLPGRENIVARIDGDVPPERGGKVLLLEAHQDTVPVDGMTIPPFEPTITGGKLYGRGSCDIKGGGAAILAAASRIAQEKPKGRPTLLIGFPANEEHGFTGARTLAAIWRDGATSPLREFLPKPDAVIVSEPTLLDVVAAHKGVLRWHCHTFGKAAHSSNPQLGESAIYSMARIVSALERYANEVVGNLTEHPLVGRPTLSVGTIAGGISVNTVPDHCVIEIDRRIIPSPADPSDRAQQHIIDYIAANIPSTTKLEHRTTYICSPGLSDQHNAALVEQLGAAIRSCGRAGRKIGVPYGTDAPAYDALNIPTVVFGPGNIAQAHTCDEHVEVDQLHAAVDILVKFVKSFA